MKRADDAFWTATLRNLAAHLGAGRVEVQTASALVDPPPTAAELAQVRQNAGVASLAQAVGRPVRLVVAGARRTRERRRG